MLDTKTIAARLRKLAPAPASLLTPLLATLVALMLMLSSMAQAAPAQAAEPPRGALVIAGGALRADNVQVWQKIVELAGGAGARIAVFPTAAGDPQRSGQFAADTLTRYGAQAFVVPLAPRLAGSDVRRAADDPALAAQVAASGGAFFVGGDQGRITAALRRPDGSDSAVLRALWSMYRRGGVIAGTSAGAAIMSSTMFFEGRAPLPTLFDGVREGHEIAPGLGFIGERVFVDQHLLVRGRFARMLPAMLAKGYRIGLGIDENTAAVVKGQRAVEIIGYKGAILLELARAATDGAGPGFKLRDARISYLDSGDKVDLGDLGDPAELRLTPGPDKEKVDPAGPEYRGPLFSSDVFGNTSVVDLLWKLCDSDQPSATGIAFGAPGTALAGRGFEFEFTRAPDSAGYASNRSESYSVHRMRMDVRPIRVGQPGQPLYRVEGAQTQGQAAAPAAASDKLSARSTAPASP
ncbi:cyanophycinase [Massilia sp. 9096]|uniref:cyanophycinase n=1 Tax=Massilia sp. 9096 TaxID=1500894 RepID=UPI000AFFFE72|nr:cyanophycinase [Massilia sp. 9096]